MADDVKSRAGGLYDPAGEHDSCGIAFVANVRGQRSHDVVSDALGALRRLKHRGATGAESDSGDGAGILLQIPDRFLRSVLPFDLPADGEYLVGTVFVGRREQSPARHAVQETLERLAADEGLRLLGTRRVPVVEDLLGPIARASRPDMEQVFLAGRSGESGLELERRGWRVGRRLTRRTGVYVASMSTRTIVYKGMLTSAQLEPFFPDLGDRRLTSAIGLVHSRFSTNTFPSWSLAQPFRLVAHNGEINTVRGNRNWMQARESLLAGEPLAEDDDELLPICTPRGSDSASFDEVLELLTLAGREVPHAVLMMVPEAWEGSVELDARRRAFYAYHATLMEPWDGPAAIAFSDGRLVGAVLDRNGLRPGRWWLTDQDRIIFASEVGVLDVDPARIVSKGRLAPGRMLLVDTEGGGLLDDSVIKGRLATRHEFVDWVRNGVLDLHDLPAREHVRHTHASVARRQATFGYTDEELRLVLAPMARDATEAIGSMGTDTPIAVLSQRPRLLFDYFTQAFAQVTNPPLDAIREQLVTSLGTFIGPELNLLSEQAEACRQVFVDFPVIDNDDLAKLLHINHDGDRPSFLAAKVSGLFVAAGGAPAMERRLDELCAEVSELVQGGVRFVVLSDRDSDAQRAPIPSLLLIAAVHRHLVATRQRTQVSLIVEAGDVREVHHVALLVGFGAAAVNPYLAMESAEDLVREGLVVGVTPEEAVANLVRALGKGLLKVMSKMGVSTVASYRGAQLFEAIGLAQPFLDRWFPGTASRIGGIGLSEVADAVTRWHSIAYPNSGSGAAEPERLVGGEYQWRRDGEIHLFDPETVFRLQHATRTGRYEVFETYADRVDDQTRALKTLRGLLRLRVGDLPAVPLAEVEPVEAILTRFATGAMSYGSISAEAHETLAIAMNSIGARSNSGEGGEAPERLRDSRRRSAVKQVASARFGVTSDYLVSATDLQIKMAQGAKPGEGGQLPGHKVPAWIAETRHSTPGVGLISPPPHHDIYSIEDLAQLIHDLKCANESARIQVKLVSELGVGTVAAGVVKAHADVVLISGHDGGTGAAPLTSIKHAGTPWELGLAETQQTLMRNGLRDRVVLQVDGQLRTGRDVVIAALLGAEEFGFATAPLVVMGCVMMRACHHDTCPVGIATQDPELRARFTGRPEFVVTFFEFVAEQVRRLLSELGLRSLDEAIGRVDLLDVHPALRHYQAEHLDLRPLLVSEGFVPGGETRHRVEQDHGLDKQLDRQLIVDACDAIDAGIPLRLVVPITNEDRSVGAMLGSEVTRRRANVDPLPDDTVDVTFVGSAGQSFGAFLSRGVTFRLDGDANDFVGKGLSGGIVVLRHDPAARLVATENVVAGNVLLYGATSGRAYISGVVGERFAVRNSGAVAVVEGTGDHALEYMTGGEVAIVGPTGRNVGAGMTGGRAFLLDVDERRVNTADVAVRSLRPDEETPLHELLREHVERTSSTQVSAILHRWPTSAQRFSVVEPRAGHD
jgi:glutamate synthase (NADPH) large chain